MTKLSDIQLILLSSAAARADGSLLPPPDTLATRRDRLHRSITGLVTKGFAIEAEVQTSAQAWRQDDGRMVGVVITDAGRTAIGVEVAQPPANGVSQAIEEEEVSATPAASATPRPSKIGQVVLLLERPDGATLTEIMAATGWLAHSTRAALTGLRKKGHGVLTGKRGDETCYRIKAAA